MSSKAGAVQEAKVAAKAAKRAEVEKRVQEAKRAATAGRIARGELMLVKCVETEGGLREVDVQTAAREFREAGVWCVEHEGRLYVETRNAHEVSEGGTRVVEPAAGGWAVAKGAK